MKFSDTVITHSANHLRGEDTPVTFDTICDDVTLQIGRRPVRIDLDDLLFKLNQFKAARDAVKATKR